MMIKRIAPDQANLFVTKSIPQSDGRDTFEIVPSKNGKIELRGSSPLAEAAAFGWYLKHIANGHLSWNGCRIPAKFPVPDEKVTISSPYKYRFAYNYCALSYTAAFWDWERWEKELDYLAANGVNRLLVTAGLEKVWQEMLREMGYPEQKINSYIAHPAYAAWWHMGNLEGEGGPVSQERIEAEAELGRKIFKRCRELGIEPVLQGFAGLLPHDIGKHIDGLDMVPQGKWVTGYQRQALLSPNSSHFEKYAVMWYDHLSSVYGGTPKAYACDLFHEGGHTGNVDVKQAAKNVQAVMQIASPGSQWILQGWQANPSDELLKGTFADERTLVIQLSRDMSPNANDGQMRTYQGRHWMWGELLNFGGNHGMYGGMEMLSKLPDNLLNPEKKREQISGLALMSEGLETNPIYYDLYFDLFWSEKNINLSDWTSKYIARRYGKTTPALEKAFDLLIHSVYSPKGIQEGCLESILCAKPSPIASKASSWSPSISYYDEADVIDAVEILLNESGSLSNADAFRYDLVDVTRQMLSDMAPGMLARAMQSYYKGDVAGFEAGSAQFLELIQDTDRILATHEDWLLGGWLERANRKSSIKADRALEMENARRLITTWSKTTDALDDYSHRQFAGLMEDYYLPRWESFFDVYKQAMLSKEQGKDLDDWYVKNRRQADLDFAKMTNSYSTKPKGDTVAVARDLFRKYEDLARELAKVNYRGEGKPWKLSEREEILEFDVNDQVIAAGEYQVLVQWRSGQSALQIESVALYEGNKKVAEDIHQGWTGYQNTNNVYILDLTKYRTNLDVYTLKVKAKGVSGVDSRGIMKIIQMTGEQ